MRELLTDRAHQVLERIRSFVFDAIDEERRRAVCPTARRALQIGVHALEVRMRGEVVLERADVEADRGGIADEVPILERALMLEEHVVHLPEATLRGGRLGRLRGVTRVRVLWTWKVAKHEPQLIAQLAPDCLHSGVR